MWYRIAARETTNPKLRDRANQGQNRLLTEFGSQEIIAARTAADNWKPIGPRLEFGPLGARPAPTLTEAPNSSRPAKPVSSGSGFFISHDGDLITNNHVIEGCRELRVAHEDKSNTARVVDTDPAADLAVLRISGIAGGVASFRTELEKPGEAVIVVGYPLQGLLTSKASVTTIRRRARTRTLDDPGRGEETMAHSRAADDFRAIRARMEDLRRERERAVAVAQTKRGAVERARPAHSDPIVISLRWLRAQLGYRCNRAR